jgi:hypothetical protein
MLPNIMKSSVRNFFRVLVLFQCLVFCVSRFWGISETATYIDELITISGGAASVFPSPFVRADSAWSYAKQLMGHNKSSYAPLQGFLVALFNSHDVFTWNSLILARWLSALAILSGLILLNLTILKVVRKKMLAWLAISLTTSLMLGSEMLFINSQQATPYALGFMTSCLAILGGVQFLQADNLIGYLTTWVLFCFLPFANYQSIVAGVALSFSAWATKMVSLSQAETENKKRIHMFFSCLILVLIAAAYTPWVIWLTKSKSDMITPWWLQDFVRPTGVSPFQLLQALLITCKNSFLALLSNQLPRLFLKTIVFFGLIFSAAIGLIRLLSIKLVAPTGKNFWTDHIAMVCLGLGCLFCFLIEVLLWVKYTGSALAPSRHSLFLLPFLSLGLVFTSLGLVKICTKAHPMAQGVCLVILFSLSTAYSITSVQNLSRFSSLKKEAWDFGFLSTLNTLSNPTRVVMPLNDSSKFFLLLKKQGLLERFKVLAIKSYEEFPQGDFIFITQFLDPHTDLLPPAHKLPYKLIKSVSTGFDYEPSSLIKYWPNDFYVWRVSEKGNL